MLQRQHNASSREKGDARELVFQALCLLFDSDTANLIIGIEVSGNPRPLGGLSPDQLQGVNGQLEEIGIEIRKTLKPRAQVEFEVALDAAEEIVAEEMRAKAGGPAGHRPEGA